MRKATDKTLEQFYKVLFKSKESQSWTWIGTAILLAVMTLITIDPIINDIESMKGTLLIFLMGCATGWSYIRVYMIYGDKEKETFEMLRLHAISGKEIRSFWCKKLAFFYICLMVPLSMLGGLYRYFILKEEINLIWTIFNADVLPFLVLSYMLFTKAKKYARGREVLAQMIAWLVTIGSYVLFYIISRNLSN